MLWGAGGPNTSTQSSAALPQSEWARNLRCCVPAPGPCRTMQLNAAGAERVARWLASKRTAPPLRWGTNWERAMQRPARLHAVLRTSCARPTRTPARPHSSPPHHPRAHGAICACMACRGTCERTRRVARHACVLTCDVVHHHCYRRVPDVAGYEAAEALLPCCVPARGRQRAKQPRGLAAVCGPARVPVGRSP